MTSAVYSQGATGGGSDQHTVACNMNDSLMHAAEPSHSEILNMAAGGRISAAH